jgi:hypothetical protein
MMVKASSSDYGEVLRLGALSLLIPPLALLIQVGHALLHSNFLNNAVILHALDPFVFRDLCSEALITFLGLFICRRFLRAWWQVSALSLLFTALWAVLFVCAEAATK